MIGLRRFHPAWVIGLLLLALAVQGCASSSHRASASGANDAQAVVCEKCRTVWVRRPATDEAWYMRWEEEGSNVTLCEGCKASGIAFMKTGTWDHACASCGKDVHMCKAP